jgi:hypothetical protein
MSDSRPFPDAIVSQPTALVAEQMLMFGNAAVLRPWLDRIARRMIRALRVTVVAFSAPAFYAHFGWYVERPRDVRESE